jgi:hypothetical protein
VAALNEANQWPVVVTMGLLDDDSLLQTQCDADEWQW